MDKLFWQHKKLADLTEEEWEAVCMRCGKCCLSKCLKNGKVYFSNQMCSGFDFKTGTCSRYKTRLNETCLKVDMRLLTEEPELLPETCAYRLLFAGKELPAYHPLVSGNPQSVHEARQTVLEIPEVYSISEYKKLIRKISRRMLCRSIATEEINKIKQLLQRYELTWIASYPVPPKS